APDQPQPAALARGAGRHQARAPDLRRRREVRARRHHRPARRDGALLPPLARDRRGRGPEPAHVRVRERGRGARARRAAPRARLYEEDNSNIHRGLHALSERATAAYESVRERVRGFLGAASTKEIVFVRGTTEAINLVAQTFGRRRVGAGDEVLVTELEHHSN